MNSGYRLGLITPVIHLRNKAVITDIFARRYAGLQIRTQYFEEDRRFMNQAAVMIMDQLWLGRPSDTPSDTTEQNLKSVHNIMALELGQEYLSDRWWWHKSTFNGNEYTQTYTNTYAKICKNYLIKMPTDVAQGDTWVKERLSLVELAFQRRWHQLQAINRDLPNAIAKAKENDKQMVSRRAIRLPGTLEEGAKAQNARLNAAFEEQVLELNERLRLALYKLTFHNGLLQVSDDERINTQVSIPFWDLVKDPKWTNVDLQIKEAIDRRDHGDRTAAFHAVSAVESCIKIISDINGWTKGPKRALRTMSTIL